MNGITFSRTKSTIHEIIDFHSRRQAIH